MASSFEVCAEQRVCAAEHGLRQKSRPSDADATRGHAPACTRLQSAPYAVVALAVHGYECCILCQRVVAGECGAWRGVHNAYVGYAVATAGPRRWQF